jgi:hypothetical protein
MSLPPPPPVQIYIDGPPGSGKHELADALSTTLGLESTADPDIEALGQCESADALAMWLVWRRARLSQPGGGVYVGSPEMWPALYGSRFEDDSEHVCARAITTSVNTLRPPEPATLRILLNHSEPTYKWSSSAAQTEMQQALTVYADAHCPVVLDPATATVEEMVTAVVAVLKAPPPAVHVVPVSRLL